MDNILRKTIINQMRNWLLHAGSMIKQQISHPLTIYTKSTPNDLVTEMDRKVELFFVEKIRRYFPDHQILTEEGFGDEDVTREGIVWLIDPIDGTMNFVHQKKNFAISLAVYEDGIGEIGMIYNVMDGSLYIGKRGEGVFKNDQKLQPLEEKTDLSKAIVSMTHKWLTKNKLVDERKMQSLVRHVRGTRAYGSATIELMLLAEGGTDIYLSMRLAPWDFAAGKIVLEELGGIITNLNGDPIDMLDTGPIISGQAQLIAEVIESYLKE